MNESMKELTLGRRIATLRRAQGLTQEVLAESLSVTAQAVSKWENDQSCPDIMTLPKLARLLEVSVDTLLAGEAPASPGTPARKPEELIIRLTFTEVDGSRFNINLPFTVFKLGARFGMITIRWNGADSREISAEQKAGALAGLDFNTMVQMIESGVTGKLLEMNDSGERLVIWTE